MLALWGVLLSAPRVMRRRPTGTAAARGGLSARLWRRGARRGARGLGVLQIVGAASGGTDPLQPLAHSRARRDGAARCALPTVRSVAELDAALRAAGRPVMLDFYADWCVSCKEMERFTFTDPAVQRARGRVLLKADVTANNAEDRALLKRFGLFGPPGTIFFDAARPRDRAARVDRLPGRRAFLQTLRTAGL